MTGKLVCAARQQRLFDCVARKGLLNAFPYLVDFAAGLFCKYIRTASCRTVEAVCDFGGNYFTAGH